ncbi:hypothetical protein BG015_000300 [Linnemannia schmuckeri]|uniref:Uncharacterized protein n=1 Tax=Linnemannia schmuckeri TaxID=64567 RepID=A0A9P5V7I8_9FUNG|nr:hypothetical protein BG015_000300 [Linnemannia schmuckeri]
MSRVSHTLETQVELLNIYHYLNNQKEDLPFKFSQYSFGPAIGVDLKQSILQSMLKREQLIRVAAKSPPPGAHYIISRKHLLVEQALLHWL